MRILIALTGDEIDHDIAATVAQMFDAERDRVMAVHVAHPREARATYERVESTDTAARGADLSAMSSDRPPTGPAEGAEQAIERLGSEFADHLKMISHQRLAGFTVEHDLVISDDPAEAIVEAVTRYSIDAITMGTRSKRSRLTSALLGSAAEKVIRDVSVPVTVVKEGTVAASD